MTRRVSLTSIIPTISAFAIVIDNIDFSIIDRMGTSNALASVLLDALQA